MPAIRDGSRINSGAEPSFVDSHARTKKNGGEISLSLARSEINPPSPFPPDQIQRRDLVAVQRLRIPPQPQVEAQQGQPKKADGDDLRLGATGQPRFHPVAQNAIGT